MKEDYPRTTPDFERRFATEEACRAYLEQLRWPNGFRCSACGSATFWRVRGRPTLFHCASCGRQTSVTAGTLFQDTRTPLSTSFRAMWWVTQQRDGASATGLQKFLDLKSYETAWTWLHKLRRAMVQRVGDRPRGRVEVDASYLAGQEKGVRGRHKKPTVVIAVAVEEAGTGTGRLQMARVADASADSLTAFVERCVVPGSILRTRSVLHFDQLKKLGYQHRDTRLKGGTESPGPSLSRVDDVVSRLHRCLLQTHRGAVSPAQLDYYLDEFTFRFNLRTCRPRAKLFYHLLQRAIAVHPAPYTSLIEHAQLERPTRRVRRSRSS